MLQSAHKVGVTGSDRELPAAGDQNWSFSTYLGNVQVRQKQSSVQRYRGYWTGWSISTPDAPAVL